MDATTQAIRAVTDVAQNGVIDPAWRAQLRLVLDDHAILRIKLERCQRDKADLSSNLRKSEQVRDNLLKGGEAMAADLGAKLAACEKELDAANERVKVLEEAASDLVEVFDLASCKARIVGIIPAIERVRTALAQPTGGEVE